MTDKKDEALKLALQALEYISSHYMSLPKIGCMALAVVEEALAEPAQQQEPVAWMTPTGALYRTEDVDGCFDDKHIPLYTTPPQRKPLTMQERTSIVRANKSFHDKNEIDAYGIIDDVEAAHGIKE